MKKLSLDDVLGLGLGGRHLQLRAPTEPDRDNASDSRIIEVALPDSGGAAVHSEPSSASVGKTNETPKPKRRGRPPGKSAKKTESQIPVADAALGPERSASRVDLTSSQTLSTYETNAPTSSSRPRTPIGTTPPAEISSPQQTTPASSTPSSRRDRLSSGTDIKKKAKFTPHNKVEREEGDAKIKAGIPGVYINPTISVVPEEQQGRKGKKRTIAVFKSAKLKIAQWLAGRAGTWKEEYAKRTGNYPASIDQNAEANEPTSLKAKDFHDGSNGSLLNPSANSAYSAKQVAQPPQPNEANTQDHTPERLPPSSYPSDISPRQQYVSNISRTKTPQNATQIARATSQQDDNLPPHASVQPPRPNSLPTFLRPIQSTYKSPYSSNSASFPQSVTPQLGAPKYKSPYQPITPPSMPTLQLQSLLGNSSVPDGPPVNAQRNGDKEESLPMPGSDIGVKRKRGRKASAAEDRPNKRHKGIPSASVQSPSILGNGESQSKITGEITPQSEALKSILKQQEEEKAKEAQRDQELQDQLLAAEAIEVPEHLVRLSAAHENSVGNLILSRDQITLTFLSMGQPLHQSPKLVLPVSTIIDNPIVSMAGSKPMELRVRSRDDSNAEVIHRFNIGLTQTARKAADVMRAKLVLARINIRATAAGSPYVSEDEKDEAAIKAAKPFWCEKCDKRFKNKEGILYHSTRSQTSCNPNFDASTHRRRSHVQTPKKKKKKKKSVKIVEPSQEAVTHIEDQREVEEAEKGDNRQSESDGSDSLDSVIEWAEKVSRPKRKSISSRRRKRDSNQADGEHPSTTLHSNEEVSEEAPGHSASEEDESMEDDVYLPVEEKSPRNRKRAAMQERWARVKAFGGNKLTGEKSLQGQPSPFGAPKRMRMPLTEEERERRATSMARKLQCWDTALSFLPNTETGAWDQTPGRVRKIHRKPIRRYELPEPITFMQSEDGAWSLRPFGHGVKPIYARPSRRADGNPFLPNYLKRLENGFRPVLMPTKNRLFLPAAPGKRLLEDPTSYTPLSSIEDVESGSRPTRRSRRALRVSLDPDFDESLDSDFRISKITGKPVRPYRRGYEPVSKGARSRGDDTANYRTRNSQDIDQIHLLNSLEPKKISPAKGRLSNPGLYSLPTGFGLGLSQTTDDELSKPDDAESNLRLHKEIPPSFSLSDILDDAATETVPPIVSDIDQVAIWEQGIGSELLCSGTLIPNYRWVNHTVRSLRGASDMQHIKIAWDNDRSFDMTTLPYTELDEVEEASLFDIPPTPQYRVPRSSLKPASQDARDLRELHRGWTTRRLTALSSDLAGLGDSPEKVAKELGAQIALPATISRTRHGDSNMTEAEDARLIVGVCVLRTLTGGLDQNIDWILVSTLFKTFSMNFLTKRWTALFQKKRVVIEKLMVDFQEAFLPAYKNGEVPPLDYDNLVAYDWNWLVDWAMKNLDMTLGTKSIELPDTRERLDKLYHVKEQNIDNTRQEGYFSLTYPVYKRMELASSVGNVLSTIQKPEAKCADDVKIDTLTLVKSWVRAAALTPDEVWDPQVMKKMFKALNDPRHEDRKGNDPATKKLVDEAAEILKAEKVIMQKNKGRATPDRSYEPTDIFFSGLRKHVTVQQFIEAAQFKDFLDQEFSRGAPCVRSDYMANEGTLMCVTHLQAHGRIRLKPIGNPMNKFGLGEGSYETRKIPKEKFRFDMDIYPTAKYLYDADNEILHHVRHTEPPRGSKLGELPVWYGVGGRLIVPLWQRVLVAFASIIALRAGSPIEALKKIFKPTLEEWEIWRLLEWGTEHGLFDRLHTMVGGWTTGEWWWLIVGWCCSGGA